MSLLGWSLALDGIVHTSAGLDLSLVSWDWEHLGTVMEQDWIQYVATQLDHKEAFHYLRLVDVKLSRQIRTSSKHDLTMLGCFTTGAVLTTEHKLHFLDSGEAVCRFCGQEDTQRHRMLFCSAHAECRQGLATEDMRNWPVLAVERGLVRRPRSLELWDDFIHQRQAPDFPVYFNEHVHIFTDGSTNTSHSVPLAAWSVVLVDPACFDATVVATGLLHGNQNNYRAELTAAWVAVQHCRSASVYIDNIAVVRGLQRLKKKGWQPSYWDKRQEAALWLQLWETYQMRDREAWDFIHVKSHREIAMQKDALSAWTAFGNNQADVAAKKPLLELPESVRSLYVRACSDCAVQSGRMSRIFTLQVRLLQNTVKKDVGASHKTTITPYEPQLQVPRPMISVSALPNQSSLMPERFMWVLRIFWFQQEWYECAEGYPLAEFYFAMVLETGWLTPVNVASWDQTTLPLCWRSKLLTAFVHEVDFSDLKFNRPCFWKQFTTFQFAVKALLKEQNFSFDLLRRKSLSYMGVFLEVPSLLVIPKRYMHFRQAFLAAIGSRSWKTFKNAIFSPPNGDVWHCPVQVSTPKDIWAAYYAK